VSVTLEDLIWYGPPLSLFDTEPPMTGGIGSLTIQNSVATSSSWPTGMTNLAKVDISLTRGAHTARPVAGAKVATAHAHRLKPRAPPRVTSRTAVDPTSPASRYRAGRRAPDTSRANLAAPNRVRPSAVSNTKAAHNVRRRKRASLSHRVKAHHSVNRQAQEESWPMGLPGTRRPISSDHRPPRLLPRSGRPNRTWSGPRPPRPTIGATSNLKGVTHNHCASPPGTDPAGSHTHHPTPLGAGRRVP